MDVTHRRRADQKQEVIMKRPKAPCKDCTPETGRTVDPNCHTTCEKYLNFKLEKKSYDAVVFANMGKERWPTEDDT